MCQSLRKILQLFRISHRIFPPSNIPWTHQAFTLSAGTHSFPFEVRFPNATTCHNNQTGITHVLDALPPSFHFVAPKNQGSAAVRYMVRVEVERKNWYCFNLSREEELLFLPSSSVPIPRVLGWTEVIRGRQYASLRILLPSSNILVTQIPLELRLFLRAQAGYSSNLDPIIVQQIRFTINSTTALDLCYHSTSWTLNTDIVHLSGINYILPPGRGFLEIDPELWKGALLPDMASSFTTCTVCRRYALSITIVFSYGQQPFTQVSSSRRQPCSMLLITCLHRQLELL